MSELYIRVVAGIVRNAAGEFLLTSRPAGKSFAGYWEFVGGKVEPHESEFAALQRECEEEIGIVITHAEPWLSRAYHNGKTWVHVRFFRIDPPHWNGTAVGREGQQLHWQKPGSLDVEPILPASVGPARLIAER